MTQTRTSRALRQSSRVVFTGVALALAVMTVLLLTPASGWAHSTLLGSSPSAGERYTPPLQRVEVQFDERVTFPDIELVTPDGREISGLASSARSGNVRITLAEPDTTLGTWTVRWGVQSADGDATDGQFTFELVEGAQGIKPLPDSLTILHSDGTAGGGERSTWFLLALGTSIGLGAIMIWMGFDALSQRIRANNRTEDQTEADAVSRRDQDK